MQEQLHMTLKLHMIEQYGAKKIKEEKKQQPVKPQLGIKPQSESQTKRLQVPQIKPAQPFQLSVERPQ